MIENLSNAKDYGNLISSDTMRQNYATFHDLPLLTFLSLISKYKWMDSIRMTFLYLFIENNY